MFHDEFVRARGLTCLRFIYVFWYWNNVRLTFMSDVLGWIIRLYKPRWNEEDQTSGTPVLETEQISRPLLWTPSLPRPLRRRPASTLISPETASICRMGTARYIQGPRAVGTASACVLSLYFCPFWLCYLSGKLVRESDKLGGMLGLLSGEACLALRAGDKMGHWCTHIAVKPDQSKSPHMCIFI